MDQADRRVRGVAGCDPHKHTLTVAIVDEHGVKIGVSTFENDPTGLGALLCWLADLEVDVTRVGVEGSAGWGLHVATALTRSGYDVREVPAPRTAERRNRRRRPKTDREDSLAIAREVLADPLLPSAGAIHVADESQAELAVICDRRRSVIRRRQRLVNEAEGVLNKLPLELVAPLPRRGGVAARLSALDRSDASPRAGTAAAANLVAWALELRSDIADLSQRIAELELRLPALLAEIGCTLTEEVGIGVVSAGELVSEVGDAARFKSEGAFARWCGVAPVAASTGEGTGRPKRHRLDLLGNRNVNRILYTMSVTQARHHPAGQEFLARKRAEGKTHKEARRAHKRQLANRVIRRMWSDRRKALPLASVQRRTEIRSSAT
jgi:transposase